MARLRYVKSAEELRKTAETSTEFLDSSIRSIRAAYETDPELVAAVLPQPLKPTSRPEIHTVISEVKIHIAENFDIEIGAATFGVLCDYEGVEGTYQITMPMTTEQAVIGGRETFGEPKKLAQIDFEKQDDSIVAKVTRMGVTYLELRGTLGKSLGAQEFTDYAYCYKALPSIEKGKGFDGDPLLVRLEWKQHLREAQAVEGEVILRESNFDPVVDLPVKRLVKLQYDEGTSESGGQILRSVPGDWLLPFIHQRYDQT